MSPPQSPQPKPRDSAGTQVKRRREPIGGSPELKKQSTTQEYQTKALQKQEHDSQHYPQGQQNMLEDSFQELSITNDNITDDNK